MRKLIIIIVCCIILTACSASAMETSESIKHTADKVYRVEKIVYDQGEEDTVTMTDLNGIWVSQFDMHPIYRDGARQREKTDYTEKVEGMISNLVRDGFNTVFLQLRPNGDSMYESDYYPMSKYIAGEYGGETEYDAVRIFLDIAKGAGISVHAWINPYRLCTEQELINYGKGTIYDWYREGIGKRVEKGTDGILYLDPYYEEATELIISGAKEILEKYDFDGIHLDDYFYPTEFEFNDESEFRSSAYDNKGDFRRANVSRTVKALYEAVHGFEGKLFGISPAGNIYSLSEGWYADIYTWCAEDGYIDYIMPQLYFGFNNATCPFESVLSDWVAAIKNEKISLYIGLSAAKCALGSEGVADAYAGENGKFEWRDNKDILARSLEAIYDSGKAQGFCIFAYSSFYDPITGEENALTAEEKAAFCETIR